MVHVYASELTTTPKVNHFAVANKENL